MSKHKNVCNCLKETAISDIKCTPEDPHKLIRKLVNLMSNPISADQYDRQVILLKELINSTTYAFVSLWVSDLPFVIKLIEMVFQRLDLFCMFREPLKCLLSFCSMPPLITRASESFTFARDIEEFFSFLGYSLLYARDIEVRNWILKVLVDVLSMRLPTPSNSISQGTRYNSIEKCEIPNIITKLLEIVDFEFYEKLLEICLILVNLSISICHKIIKAGGLDFILLKLMEPPNNKKIRFTKTHDISCNILWTLQQSCKSKSRDFKMDEYCPKESNLRNLKELLRVLTKSNSKIDRNYVMAIILQFLDLFPNFPLIHSGLASDIGVLCAATEIGSKGTWLSEVTFGTDDHDYEFKKMLITAVCYSTKIPDGLKILHPKRIIPSLLRIITPELTLQWHPQQLEKLIFISLSALQRIVETSLDDFLIANGPVRFLSIVEYYHKQLHETLLEICLKALHGIAVLNNSDILNDLLTNDAQNMLMNFCLELLQQPNLTLYYQKCLTYQFSILEIICNSRADCQNNAVDVSLTFLKRILNPEAKDHLHNPKFLISGIDFLWESVVWKENCLSEFTTRGGVYLLLDVIYKYSLPVKVVALGVLVDMCDVGLCVPHLITWRNKGKQLLPLLLELFRRENLSIGVKLTTHGIIADIEFPLMGHQQWYETFDSDKDFNSSPAAIDLLGCCRPKVYAIINLLTNRHETRVNVSNEYYRMFDMNNLNTKDKIALLLAENFLALKLGEAWVEVGEDIDKSGMRPLPIDEAFMTQLKRRFFKWSEHLQISQEKILQKKFIREYNEEMSLYKLIRESKLVESLLALHELDYIARTTEKMFSLMKKMKHCTDIDQTKYDDEDGIYHPTYLRKLKVTPVFQQKVIIRSDALEPQKTESTSLVGIIELCTEKDETETDEIDEIPK